MHVVARYIQTFKYPFSEKDLKPRLQYFRALRQCQISNERNMEFNLPGDERSLKSRMFLKHRTVRTSCLMIKYLCLLKVMNSQSLNANY